MREDTHSAPRTGAATRIEAARQALRQALIEGEESGEDSPLDMDEIRREARQAAGLIV